MGYWVGAGSGVVCILHRWPAFGGGFTSAPSSVLQALFQVQSLVMWVTWMVYKRRGVVGVRSVGLLCPLVYRNVGWSLSLYPYYAAKR